MEITAISKDWAARGFSCDMWTDLPGQQWRNFVQETDELMMLQEGEIEVTFQGSSIRPQVGEELFIPAGAMHTVRNIGRTHSRWLYGYRRKR